MPSVVRVGDVNSGGGQVVSGIPTVLVNGQPISVDGSTVSPHGTHGPAFTTSGSHTVLAGGRPVNYVGNPDSCGDQRVNGSPDVIVGV